MNHNRIFLLGYMGSGKTTLGKKVAKKLGMTFFDLDDYLVEMYGKTIPQIFEEEGEAKFRLLEREYLLHFIEKKNIILSTGGGTPCFFDNIDLMNANGITIYLNMDVDVLIARLKNAKSERPLIKGKTDEELVEFITDMLQKRNPFYKKAQYIFTDRNLKSDQIIERICNL